LRILVVIVEAGQDQVADLLDGEVLQRMRQRSDCSILDLWLGVAQQLSENLNQGGIANVSSECLSELSE